MIDLERYINAFKTLPPKAAWAEVNADMRDEYLIRLQNGKQTGCEFYIKTVYYLKVSAGEKKGIIYTEKNDEDPNTLIQDAMECAEYAEKTSCLPLGKEFSAAVNKQETDSVEDVLAFGLALNEEADKEPCLAPLAGCEVRRMTQERRVVNSLGLDCFHRYTYYYVTMDIKQKNGPNGHTNTYINRSAASLKKLNPKELVSQAVKKVNVCSGNGNLGAVKLSGRVQTCVLSADVVCNILNTAWQVFTGDRLLAGTSVYKNSGAVVGPSFLNIMDAVSHPECGFESAFDSEGVACKDKYVVENGALAAPMYTLQSALNSGQKSTGNAGRAALLSGTIPVSVITIPNIFYIKPGTNTQEDLVNQMGTGILLTYSLDVYHTINVASGDFSIPCGGIVYDNGKASGYIDQITIAGNLRDFFMNIRAVGNDLQFNEFDYKNYYFGGPSLLVKDISFSG